MSEQQLEKYELSRQLFGHTADVKCVKAIDPSIIVSGSRDTKVLKFELTTGTMSYYSGHSRYVNSITYFDKQPGYLVSGSSDKTIKLHAINSEGDESESWVGHTDNVVSLDVLKDGRVVSSSWDRTGIIWKDGKPQFRLSGHSQAVWAVKVLEHAPYPCILTGGADKLIKVWSLEGKLLNTFQAHDDCVRGIDEIPGIGYVTCSNDSSIKVWSYEHIEQYQLFGHSSFIYSVKVLPTTTSGNIELVSGGEDRCIRIWSGQSCTQVLGIPSQSIWSVDVFQNGDIITGTCDGIVRLFTKDPTRKAEFAELEAYQQAIASQALNKTEVGNVDPSKLSDKEALNEPGTKEGQVKMVKENGSVVAYQWDGTQGWVKVGEVVDAVGSKRKQLYQGKEYDYVFEINMEDGQPNLKLPYNATENPFTAAMNFINKNNLPNSYVDQVADFITKNSEPVQMTANQDFVDPYTGASRYVANQAANPTPTSAPAKSQSKEASPFPIQDRLKFSAGELTKIVGKIVEFNEQVQPELQIDPNNINILQTSATGSITSQVIDDLLAKVQQWPLNLKFPILDLLRLISLSQAWYSQIEFTTLIENALQIDSLVASDLDKTRDTVLMLGLRLITNILFQSNQLPSYKVDGEYLIRVLAKIAPVVDKLSPNAAIAYVSVLVNITNINTNMTTNSVLELIKLVINVLPSLNATNLEANYRAIVALGNLLVKCKSLGNDMSQIQAEVETTAAGKLELGGKVEVITLQLLQLNLELA